MITKAMLPSADTWPKNFCSASKPPAEQPMPITGKSDGRDLEARFFAELCYSVSVAEGWVIGRRGREGAFKGQLYPKNGPSKRVKNIFHGYTLFTTNVLKYYLKNTCFLFHIKGNRNLLKQASV
jgi:hypothetical protein